MVAALALALLAAVGGHPPDAKPSSLLRLPMQAPTYSRLCDAFHSSAKVGAWWCMEAATAATQSSDGGTSFSATGSPVSLSRRVCPNGPNCSPMSMARTVGAADAGVDGWTAGALAPPSADFSVCWLGSMASAAAGTFVAQHNGANGYVFLLDTTAGSTLRFVLFKTDGALSAPASSETLTAGARHLLCATYDYVTDGTSRSVLYIDGRPSSETTNLVGPAQAVSSPVWVARKGGDTSPFVGLTESSLYTETVLSQAQVTQLVNAVGAQRAAVGTAAYPLGEFGQSVLVTSASAQTCHPRGDASQVTRLPPLRPCLNGGGLLVEAQSTNLVTYSEALDHAAWTKAGLTVAANGAASPAGFLHADTVTLAAGTSGHSVTQAFSTTSGLRYAISVWAYPVSAEWVTLGTAAALIESATFDLSSCAVEATAGTVHAEASGEAGGWCRLSLGFVADAASESMVVAIGDTQTHAEAESWEWVSGAQEAVALWGAQAEALPWASSYVPTTTAATTRTGQSFAVGAPFSGAPKRYCLGATADLRPTWWSSNGAAPFRTQTLVSSGIYLDASGYPPGYLGVRHYAQTASGEYSRALAIGSDAGYATTLPDGGSVSNGTSGFTGESADGGSIRLVGCYGGQYQPVELFRGGARADSSASAGDQTSFPSGGGQPYLRIGTFGSVGESAYSSVYSTVRDVCASVDYGACQ